MDYEEFCKYSWILSYTKEHTYQSDIDNNLEAIIYKDFECEILDALKENINSESELVMMKVQIFLGLFRIVFKSNDVKYDFGKKHFIVNDNIFIDKNNYDEVNRIIRSQNLIALKNTYPSKKVEELILRAKKIKQLKEGNGNITLEDIVTTIKIYTGCSYDDIKNETYYQIISDFMRIHQIVNHQDSVVFASQVGTKAIKILPISGELELIHDGDEDVLKEYNGEETLL